MELWQTRVIEEKDQLDERLRKPTEFLNSINGKHSVDEVDYSLLLTSLEAIRDTIAGQDDIFYG